MNTALLNASDKKNIAACADIIRRGGTVAFPTETVYGLGANGLSSPAVNSIFRAKGRPSDNPLILHISDLRDMYSLFLEVPDAALALAQRFWPGPLTIICRKAKHIPNEVTAGLDTVALRMPANIYARQLIAESGVPLAAPSANRSGKPSPTEAQHVFQDMNGRIDAILDGGKCTVGLESTVISLAGDVPTILRPGAVTKDQLSEVLGTVLTAKSILEPHDPNTPAASPGMKYKHYAPNAEVYAVTGTGDETGAKVTAAYDSFTQQGKKCVILGSSENAPLYGERSLITLGSRYEPSEFCASLFSALRLCDEYDIVLCETLPPEGIGLAYMNRLLRAAGFKRI